MTVYTETAWKINTAQFPPKPHTTHILAAQMFTVPRVPTCTY